MKNNLTIKTTTLLLLMLITASLTVTAQRTEQNGEISILNMLAERKSN
ncbi:MAG: hypothetical protein BWZ05_01289 [Bacteroidetes bacterium ADurb.BinA245]|jgi:hypothetical protein|nr:MAG: hypothetical protein BWZ05_01289 [Bacteroidetes bacterium ADurb.BinA245]